MTLVEFLTLVALILGPVLAVWISLRREEVRRISDRRSHILNMLLSTRHIPGDQKYSAAINLIPATFNDVPDVLEAWRKYHDLVNQQPTPEQQDAHYRRAGVAQARMIFLICQHLKLGLSEGDIQIDAYISRANVDRDKAVFDALAAVTRLATAMERQVGHTETMLGLIRPGGFHPANPPALAQQQLLPPGDDRDR